MLERSEFFGLFSRIEEYRRCNTFFGWNAASQSRRSHPLAPESRRTQRPHVWLGAQQETGEVTQMETYSYKDWPKLPKTWHIQADSLPIQRYYGALHLFASIPRHAVQAVLAQSIQELGQVCTILHAHRPADFMPLPSTWNNINTSYRYIQSRFLLWIASRLILFEAKHTSNCTQGVTLVECMFDACDTIPIGNTQIHGQPPLLGDAHLGLRWSFDSNRPKGSLGMVKKMQLFQMCDERHTMDMLDEETEMKQVLEERITLTFFKKVRPFGCWKKWNPVLRGLLKGVGICAGFFFATKHKG